jgi:hypothetical protein
MMTKELLHAIQKHGRILLKKIQKQNHFGIKDSHFMIKWKPCVKKRWQLESMHFPWQVHLVCSYIVYLIAVSQNAFVLDDSENETGVQSQTPSGTLKQRDSASSLHLPNSKRQKSEAVPGK